MNNLNGRMPRPWRPAVEEFLKQMGYRYVLREIHYPARVRPGKPWVLDQWWVNLGNAPCYHDYRLVLRLKGASRVLDLELPWEVRKWLPGDDQCPAARIVLPRGVERGMHELRLCIARAGETTPLVLPANHGRSSDGWLRIGPVEVV